nr:protein of unknown function DUF20 [uncultured bacterium]
MILMPVAMLLVLWLHLLPALFAGLLVHEFVHLLAPRVFGLKDHQARAKIVIVFLLVAVIAGLTTLLIGGVVTFFRVEGGGLALLLQRMADIIDGARATMPAWVQDWLPATSDELKGAAVSWLRDHAAEVKTAGSEVVRTLAHALIGMVLGALIALHEVQAGHRAGALARSLIRSAAVLADAFRRVVFAQVRISTLNAALTAIYLLIVLPALGVNLPLKKTMVALTFIVGLLPIVGNLISNTVIVIISLSHSLPIALGSLLFLVIVHKLEYFVNARIVGSQIKARAWELLLAMLVMEAAFGVPGVIAAPVFYAYGKSELARRGLI